MGLKHYKVTFENKSEMILNEHEFQNYFEYPPHLGLYQKMKVKGIRKLPPDKEIREMNREFSAIAGALHSKFS